MTYGPLNIPLPETRSSCQSYNAYFQSPWQSGFSWGVQKLSFNKVLWSLCPNEQFNSPTATFFAVSLAVCFYNSCLGYTLTRLLKNARLEFNTCSQRQWRSMDKERMRKGEYAVRDAKKEKRKLWNKIKQDASQKSEGIQYQSQRFHANSKNWVFFRTSECLYICILYIWIYIRTKPYKFRTSEFLYLNKVDVI